MEQISYKTQTEIVTFQGREIPLENLTPILTPEQEAAQIFSFFHLLRNQPVIVCIIRRISS